MNVTTHTFSITTPPGTLDSVHELLRTVWEKSPEIDGQDQMRFETALIELTSNIFRHADDGLGISFSLTVRITNKHIEAILRDTGQPGEINLTEVAMPDELSESGRGIALIHALVDEFTYEREGKLNVWHILKKKTEW